MEIIQPILISIVAVIGIILAFYIFLNGPGFVARLIFRNAEEVKLANFVALFLTSIYFIKVDFEKIAQPFSDGLGEYDIDIIKWIILIQTLVVFAIARYAARGGIELADNFLMKIHPNQRLEPTRDNAD